MVRLLRTSNIRGALLPQAWMGTGREPCWNPERAVAVREGQWTGSVKPPANYERRDEASANYGLAVRKPGKEIPWYLFPPCLLTLLGPPIGQTKPKARR